MGRHNISSTTTTAAGGLLPVAAGFAAGRFLAFGGCSSMAEREPSKLDMRVRFPSPAPLCPCGSVVEHSLGKGEVASSILAMGTIYPAAASGGRKGGAKRGAAE